MSWDPPPHDDESNAPRPSDQPLPSSGWELPANHDDAPPPHTDRQQSYPPQQPPSPGYGQQPPFQQPQTNQLAVTSMIIGITSIPALCFCGIGFIGGIVAMIMGLVSRERIRSSQGTQTGESQALTGIICGAIAIAAGIVFALGIFVF